MKTEQQQLIEKLTAQLSAYKKFHRKLAAHQKWLADDKTGEQAHFNWNDSKLAAQIGANTHLSCLDWRA